MLNLRSGLCTLIALGLIVACSEPLVVDNLNDPDRGRALGTPADVEGFIGNSYAQIQNATLGGSNDALQPQLLVMGMENTSGLANFAMGPRGAIPRNPIDNTRGSQGSDGNFRDFLVLNRGARMAAIGIGRLDALTLGSPGRDARARAFARFVQGVGLGNLALAYDSAAVLTEHDDPEAPTPLAAYDSVMRAALNYLDSAMAIARANSSGFPLPDTWINGNALDTTGFFRLAHAYKARFRANVARTPTERAAVDWAKVIADADSGITGDFNVTMTPSAGWDVIWTTIAFNTGSSDWTQMSQFWMGMADSSGAYDSWLLQPVASRLRFVVLTKDLRFPQGATRPIQQGDTLRAGFRTFAGLPYFVNRTGADAGGNPLQVSMYDFYRFRAFFAASRIGPYPIMTRAEIRLLAAEGNLRLGQFAAAAVRIDSSRVLKGGLPALVPAAIVDTSAVVPGGVSCVPRVPDQAQSYRATKCGNIWDALKWEYRIETAYTGYGNWYFPGRGWGDLPEGTAIHWPVPYQEMDTRRQGFHGVGGVGGPGGSGPGNYGLFGCFLAARPGSC